MTLRRVVVAGFGAAGLAACQELRALGWSGRIAVLAEERTPPYDRPPLAKGFLSSTVVEDQLRLATDSVLDALELDLHHGVLAAALDTDRGAVTDSTGEQHPYDALIIATGLRPRTLGTSLGTGVHVLRTLADALRLRDRLEAGRSLVVVGAGFLGLEVAATARGLGLEVTVVEPLAEPMRDRLGPQLASGLVALHRRHGVELRAGLGVASVTPATATEQATVLLADGTRLRADDVLLAVGAAPDTGWLEGSDVPVGNGIVCDEQCRARPGVWAAGDVASWHHAAYGTRLRLEHRMNATEQGRSVARSVLGDPRPFVPVPFFWTDQYDVRIQVAGLPDTRLGPTVSYGDEHGDSFAVEWRDARLHGVAGWNAARAIMPMRRELASTWSSNSAVVAG